MSRVKQNLNYIREEDISVEWTVEEKNNLPPKYGCQILVENATQQQQKDTSFPTDAHLVYYNVNDNDYVDICRGTMSKIFDLYYDKFGPDVVKKIGWGNGNVNPKLWDYKAPEKKKRK